MLKYITILFISFSLAAVSQPHNHEQQEGKPGGYEEMDLPPDMPEEIKEEMRKDMEANEMLMEVDSKIKGLIEEIKVMYDDPKLAQYIYESQEAWETYRHSVVLAKFPPVEKYGPPKPYCIPYMLIEMSQERLETLKKWSEGIDDQECKGSIKSKDEVKKIKSQGNSKE